MDELDRIKKNVREISWANGMTLKDLRERTGANVRFCQMPKEASLQKMASALRVDPSVFLKKNALRYLYGECNFQQNITELVFSTGKTAPQIGRDLGATKSTVYKWMDGRLPTPEYVRKLADYFGISTTELLFSQEQKYKEVING